MTRRSSAAGALLWLVACGGEGDGTGSTTPPATSGPPATTGGDTTAPPGTTGAVTTEEGPTASSDAVTTTAAATTEPATTGPATTTSTTADPSTTGTAGTTGDESTGETTADASTSSSTGAPEMCPPPPGNLPPCQSCAEQFCCAEVDACEADPKCDCVFDCIFAGSGPMQCAFQCQNLGPNQPPSGQMFLCLGELCDACPF
jgi:hypothetical protein